MNREAIDFLSAAMDAAFGEPLPAIPDKRVCTKQRYSKKESLTAINSRLLSRRNNPGFLRNYYCPTCNAWHITHKKHEDDDE